MNDTSQKIKEIQKQIWMNKTPMERLKQFLLDNDDFFAFSKALKYDNEKMGGDKKVKL
jgi:hypothetical protein